MRPTLAIVGLGYVGLPLALGATRSHCHVLGLDTNDEVVTGLNASRSHIDDITDGDVEEMIARGFCASSDFSRLASIDTVVICVPTPLSPHGGPDLSLVLGAVSSVGRYLHRGMLVVLESTTYPGTTDEEVRPILESMSGLTAGKDFHLAFSPERIDPGNQFFGLKNTPKVVGGYTGACAAAASAFYSQFIDTIILAKGTREAEMAKLLENTYRHINIALVNEMARFCHELGIDLWDAINAADSKPFGFHAFRPGPGVGGHCIPIDPNYLSHNVRARLGYSFRFVELAQEINAGMPAYVARRCQDILNRRGRALLGSRILLLGVTYKPDIADTRESPAVPLARMLRAQGAQVAFHDPYVKDWRVDDAFIPLEDDPLKAAGEADLCVLLQAHRDYDMGQLSAAAKLLFDTRGEASPSEGVERL